MDTKKLEQWANQLLDTGKRNNLINFKDVKSATVEIIKPSIEEIFEKIDSSAEYEVFDPQISEESFEEETVLAEDNEENVAQKKKTLNREEYIERYIPKIKKHNQMLLFNAFMNPTKALKNIDKKAREYSEETGVNVAYIAIGFINWKEKDGALDTYRAPIMLAPITFKNDSSISPWYVQMTEEDVIINPTFDYKLNSEYGVNLPKYNDETFEEYFTKVENIVSKLGWNVSRECKIGIFSFLKINMYQDIKEHKEEILKNNNVRMLLGESYETPSISIEDGEYHLNNPLVELKNVVDADSSQVEAIEMAKAGVSFVLQGPPGTGKSQTITNVIAECIGDGKKVLFVSEKQAALNVVYDKLKKNGLEEFCLELHSHKANKKDFIAELVKTLKAPKTGVSSRAAMEIESKIQNQDKLDKYEIELHKQREGINKSLYQLYNAHSSFAYEPDINVPIECIEQKGEDYLKEAVNLLSQYEDFIPSIGRRYKENVWYGYVNTDTSYKMREDVKKSLTDSIVIFENYAILRKEIFDTYEIDCSTLSMSVLWESFFDLTSTSEILTPAFMKQTSCLYLLEKLNALKTLSDEIIPLRDKIDSLYDKDVYSFNALEINKKLTRQFTNSFGRLFNSEYKQITNAFRINRKNGRKPSYDELVDISGAISNYQTRIEEFKQTESPIVSSLGNSYNGVDTDWKAILNQVNKLKDLYDLGIHAEKIEGYEKEKYNNSKDAFDSVADRIEALQDRSEECFERLFTCFDSSIFDIENADFDIVLNKLKSCLDEFDKLDNWASFIALMQKLGELDLAGFVDSTIDADIDANHIAGAYQKNFYTQWIDYVIHLTPVLSNFNRIAHDREVSSFVSEDKKQFEISKAKIRATLSAKRPSLEMVAAGSAIQILLREGEKKRRLKSIRGLLEEAGELIQIIKPCFLMSPLSVSTYLNPEVINFDVVVFDEASQIFPQDAIGAIYRAKQLIVVGDSKQMPPSNFFNSTVDVDDTDEETGDVTDFESILDLCSASLPQKRLNWHYRSKYEQLISFSNKNFYGNGLITFPSSTVDKKGIGVDFFYCENGIFDRTSKSNREEALKVVNLVYENIEKYPNRSLGVVAFSASQQDLIDRLLSQRRIVDPSHEAFFSRDLAEPFFIKNLETVQGDERDTIIFSVGYARDAMGKFLHNFGPLNRVGGERRLNVAVTRAKYNVQLVASIHHTDIDLNRTSAEGAKLLKEYLDYAENGGIALERTISVDAYDQYDSEFELEVCEFLRSKGYSVDTQVGCSSFKIDLGLKRTDSSDYVLAIECDGASYHSSKNARDRDRLRQQILEGMGWKFYRIWSTDWFKNGVVERERLLAAVKEAVSNESSETLSGGNFDKEETVEDYEKPIDEGRLVFPEYFEADLYKMSNRSSSFQSFVKHVLEVEAPLSEEWFLKRIPWYFGRDKVTNVVTGAFEQEMYGCKSHGIIRKRGFMYLEGENKFVMRVPGKDGTKRDVKYIAPEEIAAGMYVFIKQNVTVTREGLYRALANALGFQRTTENMYYYFEKALSLLVSVLKIEGDTISIK